MPNGSLSFPYGDRLGDSHAIRQRRRKRDRRLPRSQIYKKLGQRLAYGLCEETRGMAMYIRSTPKENAASKLSMIKINAAASL